VGEAVAIPAGVGALVAAYAFLFVVENGSAVLLNATGRTRGLVSWGLGGAALNLALSLALVRPLGVAGVALGTLLAALATTTWYVPWAAGRALAMGPADLWRALPARWLAPAAVTLALGLAASGMVGGTGPRCAAAAALGLLHLGLAWRFTLEPAERARARGWLRGAAGGPA
jgi:O-antigen/teichoic acid export membrane protein